MRKLNKLKKKPPKWSVGTSFKIGDLIGVIKPPIIQKIRKAYLKRMNVQRLASTIKHIFIFILKGLKTLILYTT